MMGAEGRKRGGACAIAGTIVRYCGGVFLLIEVWRHAHWSVAASLTFSAIAVEVNNFLRGFRGGSR